MEDTLRQVRTLWLDKIKLSAQRKLYDFDQYAEQIWALYNGRTDSLTVTSDGVALGIAFPELPQGCPKVNVNKPHQLRSVFLPFLHHRNPTRTETADRRPQVPPELQLAMLPPEYIQQQTVAHYAQEIGVLAQSGQLQTLLMPGTQPPMPNMPQFIPFAETLAQAGMIKPFDPTSLVVNPQVEAAKEVGKILLGGYLNYTPNELNLKQESYDALTDGLVAGRGVLWTEVLPTVRGPMVGSFHVPIRDFFVDPDHAKARDWLFVIRRHRWPKWRFAKEFGLDPELVKADGVGSDGAEKQGVTYNTPPNDDATRAQESVTWYEIYSRCGIGTHLVKAPDEKLLSLGEQAGECVRIVVSEAYEFPANMNPSLMKSDDPVQQEEAWQGILAGLRWPIETYRDPAWPWPFAILDFHSQAGSPWPFAHLRGVLDKLRMLNWIYSHVVESIEMSSGGIWLLDRSLDHDTKEQIKSGKRELWVEVNKRPDTRMADLAHFLQAPELNKDIWQVAMMLAQQIDDDTGLTPLVLGGTTDNQWRSAAEAQIKERHSQSRPESMADTYDDFQSRVARNEAIAARTKIDPGTISVYFGEQTPGETGAGPYTQYWMQTVYNPNIDAVLAETDWRIEAGSMRKPNHQEMQQTLVEVAQNFLPYFTQQAMAGQPQNLQIVLDAWSKAGHLPNFTAQMPAPPPMPAGPPPDQQQKAA